jgi:uncharacterized membrane protein YbhN (UPF0104 family)
MTCDLPGRAVGEKMKRILSVSLRVCILVALLILLIYFHFIDFSLLRKIFAHPGILVLGAGAVFLSYMVAALRWWLILHSQKVGITYPYAFQLYVISVFSSIFVPGGTASSDAVRIVMLMRRVPGRRTQAVLSVFADRFIAVLMLSLLAAFITVAQWEARPATPSDPMFWLNVSALLLPGLLVIVACAAWLVTRTSKNRGEQDLPDQNWIARTSARTSDFFELALENRLGIILAMGASTITTALLLGTIVIVSAVAAIPSLSHWEIAQAAALSQFANGLPISPGGVGVGEAAFNQICIWMAQGTEHYPYATIFLAYRIISVLVACCGGIALMNVPRLMRPHVGRSYLSDSEAHTQHGNS